ncbi:transposase [Acidithiobacillus sulfuriphilus]
MGKPANLGHGSGAPDPAPDGTDDPRQRPTSADARIHPRRLDTTLPESFDPQAIIALYADHATHEQFHAEIKTDLDLERLPSGKFATNDLLLTLGALAYNILRMIGQETLLGPDAPPRHPAKRRRVKTVIQEIITLAARIKRHARQWILAFPANTVALAAFTRLHTAWSTP